MQSARKLCIVSISSKLGRIFHNSDKAQIGRRGWMKQEAACLQAEAALYCTNALFVDRCCLMKICLLNVKHLRKRLCLQEISDLM